MAQPFLVVLVRRRGRGVIRFRLQEYRCLDGLSSCRNVIVRGNTVINALKLDLEAPCYGSSTMEKPIYGEHYEGVIQFEKASDWIEENNHIFSTRI